MKRLTALIIGTILILSGWTPCKAQEYKDSLTASIIQSDTFYLNKAGAVKAISTYYTNETCQQTNQKLNQVIRLKDLQINNYESIINNYKITELDCNKNLAFEQKKSFKRGLENWFWRGLFGFTIYYFIVK